MGVMESWGSLLIALPAILSAHRLQRSESPQLIPSLGSATANEAFFSSLMESSNDANRGVTLPSTNAETSSKAVAALSNFWKFFNFSLYIKAH